MTRSLRFLLLVAALTGCSTRAFFFRPHAEVVAVPDATLCQVEPVAIPSHGSMLDGFVLRPLQGPALGTVLFLHGNYGNVSNNLHPPETLARAGFQVVTFDYRGFGKSPGEPSQESILEDALASLEYVRGRADLGGVPLVLFGQSMGGHLAVVVAARSQGSIDALAIEGAFTGYGDVAAWTSSAPGFLTRALVPERYRALDVVANVGVPLLVIHSTDDAIVPVHMGEQLFQAAAEPKHYWKVSGRHVRASQLLTTDFQARFLSLLEQARPRVH